jgi:crossover junction endodeoxyribonuclease RuvC
VASVANESEVVLGIDPGTHNCGWGVVVRRGNRFVHVAHGVARAPSRGALPERLAAVADGIEQAIREHRPTAMAIEQAFFHKDAQSALMLGHARGVAMLLAARHGLAVGEYPPAMVKRTVVGNGRAEKQQVNGMVRAILGLGALPELDASDALAVAICHASASRLGPRGGAR